MIASSTDGMQFSNNMSISMWIKPSTAGQQSYCGILDYSQNQPRGWVIEQSGTNNLYYFKYYQANFGTFTSTETMTFTLNPGYWNHFVLVKSDRTVSIYVNRTMTRSFKTSDSVILPGNPLIIGAEISSEGNLLRNFKGHLDDLFMYNRPLITSEINTLYSAQLTFSSPTSRPSSQPSRQPISRPSSQPTTLPSNQPTTQPTSQPSRQPASVPTSQPTRQPTRQPTSQPSMQPSRRPTSQPTSTPSFPFSFPSTLSDRLIAYFPLKDNLFEYTGHIRTSGTKDGNISLVPNHLGELHSAHYVPLTSYITLAGSLFNFPNSMTIAFWVKPSSSQVGWNHMISRC